MSEIRINCSVSAGKIKPMNAVNNGPVKARADQTRGNSDTYSKAGAPYARMHDASFCAGYGGEHTVDVHAIFRNFDADPDVPESYDFVLTDQYLKIG